MTFRKRRRPTPGFGIPPPFSPATGTHATLRVEGVYPYCAMMQVAAADTYADYVICRGFDPRIRRFIDYAAGDPNKPGISVAKPFGNRVTSRYQVGEIYPAFLPTQGPTAEGGIAEDYVPPSPTTVDWRVGQNPGKASTAHPGGHPTALVDAVTELTDHNSVQVPWMLIDNGGGETKWGIAKENWTDNGASCDHVVVFTCDDCEGSNPTTDEVTVLLPKTAEQDPNVVTDDVIGYVEAQDGTHVCVTDYLNAKIGTVWLWSLASGGIPPGWAIMNGSANSSGSGIDMTSKFVKGGATAGTSGGRVSHTHQAMVWVGPHKIDAIPHTHEHSLIIHPHPETDLIHSHDIPTGTVKNEGTEVVTFYPVGAEVACTKGGPKEGESGSGITDCPTNPWGPLHHRYELEIGQVTGTGMELHHETHVIYVSEEDHEPQNVTLIFIERIDNSV